MLTLGVVRATERRPLPIAVVQRSRTRLIASARS
jgi:hypothetical protein